MQPDHKGNSEPKAVPADISAKEMERGRGEEKKGGTKDLPDLITQGGEAGMREQRAAEDTQQD